VLECVGCKGGTASTSCWLGACAAVTAAGALLPLPHGHLHVACPYTMCSRTAQLTRMDASVDLPLPLVPHSSTTTHRRRSRKLHRTEPACFAIILYCFVISPRRQCSSYATPLTLALPIGCTEQFPWAPTQPHTCMHCQYGRHLAKSACWRTLHFPSMDPCRMLKGVLASHACVVHASSMSVGRLDKYRHA
jgi:hypothetical protein